ncbi:hypothetical protein BJ875DRAFT_258026 [Amylocarpus encephaloides]|uniref:Uncharacterized protein n=1 Tax=Amylocarpus encephaloides TaxID=45428 RepID=A0A9P8C702_9HELO|nr:hypothetical protein BJ875DRAFT_258026 [Amylocarpus encephaloides]
MVLRELNEKEIRLQLGGLVRGLLFVLSFSHSVIAQPFQFVDCNSRAAFLTPGQLLTLSSENSICLLVQILARSPYFIRTSLVHHVNLTCTNPRRINAICP